MGYRFIRASRFPENDVNDILSRCFELAWNRFDEYLRKNKPDYWFFNIVRNKVSYERRMRARGRVLSLPSDRMDAHASQDEGPEQTTLRNEERSYLRGALDTLPENYQLVVKLRMEQFEYSEIAAMLGISVKAAQHRMKRAMEKLEGTLREFIHDYLENDG